MANHPLRKRSRTRHCVQISFLTVSLYERDFPFDDRIEDAPGTIEPWQAVAPIRPDTAFVRATRFLDSLGEALAAFVLVIGGPGLIGVASLIGGIA